jgi:RNA polymerase sigma-B factor
MGATTTASATGNGDPTVDPLELFRRYAATGDPRIRDRIVQDHIGLARFLARRFAGRGEPSEDLEQVAYLGLLLAVGRFDPDRGIEFVRFAAPTITGELKRYLRDKAWGTHVPRRIKELHLELYQAVSTLSQTLGRSPTIPELAAVVRASEEDVLEAMEAGRGYRPGSLDVGAGGDDGAEPIVARLGGEDTALGRVDEVATAAPILARLPDRDRELLRLRFYEGLTQSQIAERLGCSQVHVSRLMARALERVRAEVDRA